ncbi:MAG: hypothetical protein JRN01_02045 [Nitrososphaerota archaeon]|nr:hypothetical protein [Nitrososphaerota archaeon]
MWNNLNFGCIKDQEKFVAATPGIFHIGWQLTIFDLETDFTAVTYHGTKRNLVIYEPPYCEVKTKNNNRMCVDDLLAFIYKFLIDNITKPDYKTLTKQPPYFHWSPCRAD